MYGDFSGTGRGVIAVSARQRHLDDFNGLLTAGELKEQNEELMTDSNSLHLLTEGHRGSVRLSVIKAREKAGLPAPQRYTEWYVPHLTGFLDAAAICEADAGLNCFVY